MHLGYFGWLGTQLWVCVEERAGVYSVWDFCYLISVAFLQQSPDIISGDWRWADRMIPHMVDPLLHRLHTHTQRCKLEFICWARYSCFQKKTKTNSPMHVNSCPFLFCQLERKPVIEEWTANEGFQRKAILQRCEMHATVMNQTQANRRHDCDWVQDKNYNLFFPSAANTQTSW